MLELIDRSSSGRTRGAIGAIGFGDSGGHHDISEGYKEGDGWTIRMVY